MDFKAELDEAIAELLDDGLDAAQIARVLLDEDFRIEDEDGDMVSLLEVVRRRRIRVGGINVTVRKTGRPNPQRSLKAKMSARRHRASRMRASRKFNRSAKARKMRRVMSRVRKSRRGRPITRRHGPPRRGRPTRPRRTVRRPARPGARRMRAPRPRKPSYRPKRARAYRPKRPRAYRPKRPRRPSYRRPRRPSYRRRR